MASEEEAASSLLHFLFENTPTKPRSLNSSLALWPERSIRRVNNPMSSVRFCSESHLLLQELQRVENENPLGNNVNHQRATDTSDAEKKNAALFLRYQRGTREGQPRSSYRPFKSFLNETESLISKEATCSKSIVRIDNGRMGGYGYKESLLRFVEGLGPTANKLQEHRVPAKVSALLSRPVAMESFWLSRQVALFRKGDQPALSRPYETSVTPLGYCGQVMVGYSDSGKDVDRFTASVGTVQSPRGRCGYPMSMASK
ncbi:hypothetical protein IFM89_026888 [Coptis chinensis]|uniref:Uncharacterized protein n=1 Tax=Coptis chinensis TaxID=261450 RepID=A0A835H7F1_9MAGN|nr:hypothetical protein IFM89_026888 [Coptis chinensis]